jgi:serine/threonine protein kinase
MTIKPEPGQALSVGVVVADTYQIMRLLGRGGMGSVWEASHLRLPGKRVAIKVLHADVAADQEALARFKREAEIASRLGHPNIIEVHDFNTLPGGQPYLVLELLVGESLDSRLRRAPVTLDDAMRIAGQIGAALAAAHREDVIHRDLKPQNVFLVRPRADETGAAGELVKVLDFGISKIRGSQTIKTLDSTILGTPQYMAPEQATGNHAAVDQRTDVFALAAISYEMLAGRPAFSGQSVPEVVFKVVYEQPPPLSELAPGLPRRVADAVERGLSKKQEDRFPDVVSFIEQMAGVSLSTLRRQPISMLPVRVGSEPDPADPLAHTVDSSRRDLAFAPPPVESRAQSQVSQAPISQAPISQAPISVPPPSPRRRTGLFVVLGFVLAGAATAAIVVARSGGGGARQARAPGKAERPPRPPAAAPPAAQAAEPAAEGEAAAEAATEAATEAADREAEARAEAAEAAADATDDADATDASDDADTSDAPPRVAQADPAEQRKQAALQRQQEAVQRAQVARERARQRATEAARSLRPSDPGTADPDPAGDAADGDADGDLSPREARTDVRAALVDGERALRAGDFRQALVLAERAERHGAGPAAHGLRARASCGIGDLGNAKASFLRIPRRNLILRRRVLSFCTKSGVDLGD